MEGRRRSDGGGRENEKRRRSYEGGREKEKRRKSDGGGREKEKKRRNDGGGREKERRIMTEWKENMKERCGEIECEILSIHSAVNSSYLKLRIYYISKHSHTYNYVHVSLK